MQTMSSSVAVGTMAAISRSVASQSRICGKAFVSGTSLPSLDQKSKVCGAKRTKTGPITTCAKLSLSDDDSAGRPSVPMASSIMMLLSNIEAAKALTKDDVDDAYVKAEEFSTQVTTTAGSAFETVKEFFDKVFTTVKPGIDVAVPYVQQTTESVSKFAGPLASDLAGEAQKALKNAGLDTEPGVEFAKSAAEQTSKVLEGAKPLGSSVLESALAADPLFLAEAAGGLILVYFLAPSLVSLIAGSWRGYSGDLGAAAALDLLLKQDYSLIDIRTEKEKERSGVPSLPSNSRSKYVAIPLDEFPGKIKSQLRNSRKVEAEVAAIKIASLKRLNKGSKIAILDESGDIAKSVARSLKAQGFKNSFVITDGFKGGRGWVQSRLGTDRYSGSGLSLAEVLSPSRIIPAGTKKYGSSGSSTARFNLLPGGVDD